MIVADFRVICIAFLLSVTDILTDAFPYLFLQEEREVKEVFHSSVKLPKSQYKNSTTLLYKKYRAFVQKVQGLCTKSTRRLYKLYKGHVLNRTHNNDILKGYKTVY